MNESNSLERVEVSFKSLDGSTHTAWITPLRFRDGSEVLHIILGAIGGSLDSDSLTGLSGGDLTAVLAFVGKLIKSLEFESFFEMARKLLRYSTIDLKECKDLNEFDGFRGRFADLYSLVFEALKVNYPDFFGMMGSPGLTEPIDPAGSAK